MNGRVQDAITGRFLSADPNIPDPTNAQDYNRYSYVDNNPLTMVDLSGFSEGNQCPPSGDDGCISDPGPDLIAPGAVEGYLQSGGGMPNFFSGIDTTSYYPNGGAPQTGYTNSCVGQSIDGDQGCEVGLWGQGNSANSGMSQSGSPQGISDNPTPAQCASPVFLCYQGEKPPSQTSSQTGSQNGSQSSPGAPPIPAPTLNPLPPPQQITYTPIPLPCPGGGTPAAVNNPNLRSNAMGGMRLGMLGGAGIAVWGASHFVGVGEAADLAGGVYALDWWLQAGTLAGADQYAFAAVAGGAPGAAAGALAGYAATSSTCPNSQ